MSAIPLIILYFVIAGIRWSLSKTPVTSKRTLFYTLPPLAILAYAWIKGGDMSFHQDWVGPLGINLSFSLDGISKIMVLLSLLTLPVVLIVAEIEKTRNGQRMLGLIMLMMAAMIGAFTTTNAMLFYIFYEVALIPVYFMILWWSQHPDKSQITLRFFIYTLLGSLFMLLALLKLYSHAGTFEMDALIAAGRSLPAYDQSLVFAGFFIAFAVKIPVFPFHGWQPSTYDASPTPAVILLSAVMLKMASYGLIRWAVPSCMEGIEEYGSWAIWLCVISVIYASFMAIAQTRLKLLLAWSSVAHLGLMTAGILSLNVQGIQGAVFEMLSHAILSAGLFYVYHITVNRVGHDNFKEMGGIRAVNPMFAFMFFALVMGSVALPLTSGFVGEFLLIIGLYQAGPWYAIIGGLTVVLGAVYMLRAFQAMMLGKESAKFDALTTSEKWVLGVCVLAVVMLGIYPEMVMNQIGPSVQNLFSVAVK
jgi:NADH-quinone oxidoreductase subunit M